MRKKTNNEEFCKKVTDQRVRGLSPSPVKLPLLSTWTRPSTYPHNFYFKSKWEKDIRRRKS